MNSICYPATGLLSLQQAQQRLQASLKPLADIEILPLTTALGRVLASTPVSAIDIPGQRMAAMDGYAYISQPTDQPQTLSLVGYSWAGKPFDGCLLPGQCVRIFTGAVIPDEADSVIAQEQVVADTDNVQLPANAPAGKNIRAAGSDTARGSALLSAPKPLSAIDLGVLASAGIAEVPVIRQLRIGFFSTGDELCALGQPLTKGQIYDSNRYLLAGLLNDPLYQVTDLGVVPDDLPSLLTTLQSAAAQHDVIISSGGVSVGEADWVKTALEQCGEIDFWKLAIKPGKPLAFGNIGDCRYFGLPGNPVAVLVTFQQLVKPALQQLAGLNARPRLQVTAISDDPIRKNAGRQEFQRGILYPDPQGHYRVSLAGGQDSHQLRIAALANCFIMLAADSGDLPAGSPVIVEPFDVFL